MKRARKPASPDKKPALRPALTPEAREGQLISLAVDLVEQRLRDGTATSQEVVHFLKLGSMRERLEREKLEHENRLLEAKKQAIESAERMDEMYSAAIRAMQIYQGRNDDEIQDY